MLDHITVAVTTTEQQYIASTSISLSKRLVEDPLGQFILLSTSMEQNM